MNKTKVCPSNLSHWLAVDKTILFNVVKLCCSPVCWTRNVKWTAQRKKSGHKKHTYLYDRDKWRRQATDDHKCRHRMCCCFVVSPFTLCSSVDTLIDHFWLGQLAFYILESLTKNSSSYNEAWHLIAALVSAVSLMRKNAHCKL